MTLNNIEAHKSAATAWFKQLRDLICQELEAIEQELSGQGSELLAGKFLRETWNRPGGGGGEKSLLHGRVFEKAGVNISTVHGEFSEKFRHEIPGAEENPNFWASGISLVIHPYSPLVPAIHLNTRFIVTTKHWFGGGVDLTPAIENSNDTARFHQDVKDMCDKHNLNYYPQFKKQCDEYFFLPHRKEARGIGGIFYDYLNTNNWNNDFAFTQDVGKAFLEIYPKLVREHMNQSWTLEQRERLLVKRGRYVEFNLLYDRGTKFGLMTDGNTEAILMSLPPIVKWP
ncbi:Coproporphyrinogen-III oxidase, aerobic [Rickettsiales bacterium Ac37b]|nr:Coproporphyrinogen-III oxidase, aerobic [Rickettsiales bacterium Ac37b]